MDLVQSVTVVNSFGCVCANTVLCNVCEPTPSNILKVIFTSRYFEGRYTVQYNRHFNVRKKCVYYFPCKFAILSGLKECFDNQVPN